MKKNLFVIIAFAFIFSGCDLFNTIDGYRVGDTGPAGGTIVYDVDEDNEDGNSDGLVSTDTGWRYIEAAPGDISQNAYGPYINKKGRDFRNLFKFGYYRTSDASNNLYVNGLTHYSETNCTSQDLGAGKQNTELLVAKMDDDTYKQESGGQKYLYAAKLADGVVYGGYSDWYLPSLEELNILYENKNVLVDVDKMPGTTYYWSSSEGEKAIEAYTMHFTDGTSFSVDRSEDGNIRCIRYFL